MKSETEVQRVHDIFTGIILGDAPCPQTIEPADLIKLADVLCWVLDHDHNDTFSRNLVRLEAWLKDRGYELKPK